MTASLEDRAAACGLNLAPIAPKVGCRIDGIDLAAPTEDQFAVLLEAFGGGFTWGSALLRY